MRNAIPDNMRLREVDDDDHEWLFKLHNDPVVLHNMTHPEEISFESHMRWWDGIKTSTNQMRLVFTVDSVRAGFAKFYDIDRTNHCCVLGGDIHSDFRGKGYAKHMWALMLNKCFDDLQLHRVSLTTAEYNVVAQRVYFGLGFKHEGKLTQSLFRDGRYWDQVCAYMLDKDWVDQ